MNVISLKTAENSCLDRSVHFAAHGLKLMKAISSGAEDSESEESSISVIKTTKLEPIINTMDQNQNQTKKNEPADKTK